MTKKTVLFLVIGGLMTVTTLVPGLGLLGALVGMFLMAFDRLDYAFDHYQLPFVRRVAFVRKHLPEMIGFAGALGLTTTIPVINILVRARKRGRWSFARGTFRKRGIKKLKDVIHKRLVEKRKKVDAWFVEKSQGLDFPIYSSVDIRDAGVKLASVDANIFPAGFNNICDVDQDSAKNLFQKYLVGHYKKNDLKILLLTEEHTTNRYYWENIATLSDLISKGGFDVRIAVPKEFSGSTEITSPKGHKLQVYSAKRDGAGIKVSDGFVPDLVVSNNDFSNPYAEWFSGLEVPMNPTHELGWFRRKKSDHFLYYNELATEFSKIIDVDPWTFTVETELVEVDFADEESVKKLAAQAQTFIDRMQGKYKSSLEGCSDPVIFIKNNRGTYGMGIITVKSGEELINLSQKERKKMGYAKGGNNTHEVILQEGIPTQVSAEGDVAEPAVYLIGNQLAGGFMRANKGKGRVENLNSPGAVFKRLCMSDLMVDVEGSRLENVYGWVARLNALAIGREGKFVGAQYGFSGGA